MSPKQRRSTITRKRAGMGSARILVFGENDHDTQSLKQLIEALRPEFTGKVVPMRQPLVLIKNASPEDVPSRAQRIAKTVDIQRARYEVACVFAHEDCDDLEPNHEAVSKKIESALVKEGCPAHAVVPAWEMEAWWFMWPQAVQAVRPKSWRAPEDYLGREVGKIRNAKEELCRRLIPAGLSPDRRKNFPHYKESDSPEIARRVREKGLARAPGAKSGSYTRFVMSVDGCRAR